ncbi:acyltransferase [Aminipila terrae]|uniref:Acyltransferase family protein n=1 Tax=Aminipila terrae TaxID=2697030 RepID=A0A6P1MJB6_9FIRM|nr:acyltransferase family protein [Aminipila terrae]QHI72098.1 acyltransferase family protein [Aminipila terrae]
MERKHSPERLINYDILRILAAYLIVMLHLSVQYINKAPASVEEYLLWQQGVKFGALSRVGVPIFVMLSGAFLLRPEKNISLETIFKKYLPKLIAIFLFWSFFYSLAEQGFFEHIIKYGFSHSWNAINWTKFWYYFAQGHYHMWYLYMLAGLYLITPLIKHITAQASKSQLIYFVVLCVLITSVTKLNEDLWHISILHMILDKLSLSFFLGYIGYFVAGYLLSIYTPGWRISAFLFILGVFSLRFTYQETWSLNPMFGFNEPNLIYFSNYSPTVFFMSFAVFLIAAKLGFIKLWKPLRPLADQLPKYMLAVYLVHPFIIDQCRRAAILLPAKSAWSLPQNAFIIFIISLIVSIILMQIYWLVIRIIQLVFRTARC